MRVMVCHPGRQHSHQLAMALAERGMLAKYVAGSPHGAIGGRGKRFLEHAGASNGALIDPAQIRQVYSTSLARKAAARVLSPALASAVGHGLDNLFDRSVCRLLSTVRPNAVVAYENSARHTFRRARELGIRTILDAASVHHRWQDRFFRPIEGEAAHRRITRHKDEEIALADRILTVSELARESYLDSGVPRDRVHVIPVGVDCRRFCPDGRWKDAEPDINGDMRFVYVGNSSPLKGIEVFCEAVRRLRAAGERVTATLIGVTREMPAGDTGDGIVRKRWMSHQRLTAELLQHHVFVLPSFFDSFGMVVAEAMASGLPAIVTENVGTKELITAGVNGLVVRAGDTASLTEAMQWFVARRSQLPQMSRAARESAERYDWTNYRRRVVEFFSSLSVT
jgi:glycosyltransferase involved in cell wall biosynthesis